MAGNTNIIKIEKLDGSNFLYWKKRVTLLLKSKKLWSVTSGERKRPNKEEAADWDEDDVKAMSIIVNSMDDNIFKQVMTAETSHTIWTELNIFERRSEARVTELQNRLLECKLQDEQSVIDYVSEMKNMKYSLEAVGEVISEGMLIAKILNGLPTHKYSKFLTAWRSKTKNEKTLTNLTSELSAEESLINKTETDLVAMTAAEKYSRKKPQASLKNKHVPKEKEDAGIVCFYYKKVGHKKVNCFKLKGNQHNYNYKKNSKSQSSGRKKNEEQGNDEAFMVNATEDKLDELKNDTVFEAREVTTFTENLLGTEWIGDSGASCHMTNDRHNFTTFEELSNH